MFLDRVEQNDDDAVVFDAFYFAFLIVGDKKGLGFGHVLGAESEVGGAALLPVECDRLELGDNTQSTSVRFYICLVSERRRAKRELEVLVNVLKCIQVHAEIYPQYLDFWTNMSVIY